MKKFCLFVFLLPIVSSIFCQNYSNSDTINSNIIVKFNKVKRSFKEANTAFMQASYLPKCDSIILSFDVPSYIYRHNTSLNDYCIVKSKAENFRLPNKVEAGAKGANLDIYGFTFIVSKESLKKMLSSEIKNFTFYFTPNEHKVKKHLTDNIYLTRDIKKLWIKLSKKTIKHSVSKPDKVKYAELLTWINAL